MKWLQLSKLTYPSHIVTFFCRENIYFLSKFSLHSMVLLTVVIMLYISSLDFCFLHNCNCMFWLTYPHFLHHHAPGNYCSTLFLFIRLFKIPYINDIMHCLSFYVWLTSPGIMSSRSVHVFTNGKIALSFSICAVKVSIHLIFK